MCCKNYVKQSNFESWNWNFKTNGIKAQLIERMSTKCTFA